MGGLAGAVAMLLLAPQSGKRTRAQIQLKSMNLREQTAEAVEDALKQARTKGRQIRADVREKADELQQRGQAVLDEQKERLATLVEAGKTPSKADRDAPIRSGNYLADVCPRVDQQRTALPAPSDAAAG